MTERQAALATLAHGDSDERAHALDIFYQRYRDNPLVLDKWFQVQAWNHRSEEHTSELQSLMRISYAVFCLTKKTTQPQLHILQTTITDYLTTHITHTHRHSIN